MTVRNANRHTGESRYPVPEVGCFATVVVILRPLDSGIRLWRTSSTFAGVTSLQIPNAIALATNQIRLTAPVPCAILRPQPNMILAGAWFCQAERAAEKPPTVAPDPGNAGVGIGIFH